MLGFINKYYLGKTMNDKTNKTEQPTTRPDEAVLLSCGLVAYTLTHKINPELLNKEQKKQLILEKRLHLFQENAMHLLWTGHNLPFYDILKAQYQNEYQLQNE